MEREEINNNVYINVKNTNFGVYSSPGRFDISLLDSVPRAYLGLNTEKRGEEPGNSNCGQVLGRKVSVEPLELVQGQKDAEQVDHDPQSVQDIVSIWTLEEKKIS